MCEVYIFYFNYFFHIKYIQTTLIIPNSFSSSAIVVILSASTLIALTLGGLTRVDLVLVLGVVSGTLLKYLRNLTISM